MQLVLVSGLSGSGKTIALRVLEDAGYYCVDNLPANLLLETVDFLAESGHERAAVSIDARSAALPSLPEHIAQLKSRGVDVRVLYLEASSSALLRRFSETRRRHPIARDGMTLAEAIEQERTMLAGIAPLGSRIDTSELQPRVLQNWIRDLLGITVPKVTIPVAAGRNLAVLVEAAVRNAILKLRGIDTTAEFLARQKQQMDEGQ